MHLSQILRGTGVEASGADPEITSIAHDSRQVKPGTLFFCLPGQTVDGHDFARAAIASGAAAVVGERSVEGVEIRRVPSVRKAMALAAANFYGRPAEKLTLLGITGTNGKTTISWLLEAIAMEAGRRPGVIGTVNYRFADQVLQAPHTTPESVELQQLLATMVEAGCDLAVMEVSSHGLALDRVWGLAFDVAAFTHLTRDHLDFHEDMESYFDAKAKLFREQLAEGGVAILNGDDPWCRRLAGEMKGPKVWRFSTADDSAEFSARGATFGIDGIRATLATPAGEVTLHSPLVGAHNLQNLLTATALALAAGIPLDTIGRALSRSGGAPGRLQRVDGPNQVVAFVDYAHTDDALRRASETLREVATGRLITVFGCGGDRDRGKRPLMGEAAGATADLVVVTSDNPRTEDPAAIVEGIVPGLERAGCKRLGHEEALAGARGFTVVIDRREAIDLAAAAARPGDVILIAGKGHETYQILGSTKIPFDDAEEARRALGA